MNVIEIEGLSHYYGAEAALSQVTLAVPEGSFYALLGPNGAGKTTLLRIVANLLTPSVGAVRVLGEDARSLSVATRAQFTFMGESLQLPPRMTLKQLEAFVAPLYPRWDEALASDLRRRFRLPYDRRLRSLSRGEQTKAALLCALAPRPRLLLLDEPFTGVDALVKDELVSGVLDVAAGEGCTVLVSSHDLAELENLADTVGFLEGGVLRLSESMDALHDRFRRVELRLPESHGVPELPGHWLDAEVSGTRATFLTSHSSAVEDQVATALPGAVTVSVRGATLREVFVALARRAQSGRSLEEAHR